MATQIALMLATAIIGSALTIAAAWFLYHKYVKQLLVDWIDSKAVELGGQARERVSEGVQAGIRAGLSELRSELVQKATEGATKSGFGMFEGGMTDWFGSSRNKKKKDDES